MSEPGDSASGDPTEALTSRRRPRRKRSFAEVRADLLAEQQSSTFVEERPKTTAEAQPTRLAEAPFPIRDEAQTPIVAAAVRRVHRGAGWFNWIAAMSLINTAAYFLGIGFTFVIGLEITNILNEFARLFAAESGPTDAIILHGIAFGVDALIAGFFLLFARQGRKGRRGYFIAGIAIYVCDTVLMLVFEDWLGLGFHLFALFYLVDGFRALRSLPRLRQPALAY
jgi:hypothetical protein